MSRTNLAVLNRGLIWFPRPPEKCEGILIVGKAQSAERRDIEGVADVRQPFQAVQPPDGETRSGDRKADVTTSMTRTQLAEPLAQQLEGLRRRATHRRGALGWVGMIAASPGEARSSA